MEIDFHPQQDVIAVGTITGRIHLFKYFDSKNSSTGQPYNQFLFSLHGSSVQPDEDEDQFSCRALRFSFDGQYLFNGSADKSINVIDLNTSKLVYSLADAHTSGISTMTIHKEYNLITGDDEGVIKLWDLRTKNNVHEWNENEDFISEFAIHSDGNTLLAAGGDGYLSVLDIRKGKLEARSDNLEDELLSISIIKNGTKVVTGTQDGILSIWSWGYWGDVSDRFPGHPQSISALINIDDTTLCTGSSDGIIRVVTIQPNKLLGVVGEHSTEDFPIERMKLSRDRQQENLDMFIASTSHDGVVKFWNVQFLFDRDEEENEMENENMENEESNKNEMESEQTNVMEDSDNEEQKKKSKKKKKNLQPNFFGDML